MSLTGMDSSLIIRNMLLSLKNALKTGLLSWKGYSELLNMSLQLLNSMNFAIIKAPLYLLGRVSSMRKHLAVLHLLTGTKIDIAIGRQILQLSYFSWILELFIGSNKIKRGKQFANIQPIFGLGMAIIFKFVINAMSMDHLILILDQHTNFPMVWIMTQSNQRVT